MSNKKEIKLPANRRDRQTGIKFTATEYAKIKKDSLKTGMSIPQLLREAYRKNPTPKPRLTENEGAKALREIKEANELLNKAAKRANSGFQTDIAAEIDVALGRFRTLKSYLGLDDAPPIPTKK